MQEIVFIDALLVSEVIQNVHLPSPTLCVISHFLVISLVLTLEVVPSP